MNNIIPFEKSFASHPKSQFWSDKNNINPKFIFKSSGKKYYFNCEKCNHEFEMQLDNVCKDRWCPYCCIPSRRLCEIYNCKNCYNRSFASHSKSKYWSEINKVTPRELFLNNNSKFWFNCDKCSHIFLKALNDINFNGWCPYCCNQKLCDNYKCNDCFLKSFASHSKSRFWSLENKVKPREVFKNSNKKFKFLCDCNHIFDTILRDFSNDNGGCPYCSIPGKKLCSDMTCQHCLNRSFESHPKSCFWSLENKVKTREVFKNSNKKYWFICEKNHKFESSLGNINNNQWCPLCKNKTEGKLFTELQTLYPSLITQFKQDWCKRITYLPFDFCIPEYKIIIELDGRQHFKQVSNWSSPEEQFDNDKYKETCANDNEYSIIRLLQEDVYYDKYDWFKELCDAIEDIKNGDEVVNIYLCKNNEYNDF